jgi:hypothetical protein
MAKYRATYVISSSEACGDRTPTDFAGSPAFTSVYEQDDVTIWKLTQG